MNSVEDGEHTSWLLKLEMRKLILSCYRMRIELYIEDVSGMGEAGRTEIAEDLSTETETSSVIKQEDSDNIIALAGGGFRDMSRIAKSSPNMWEDIFRQNRSNMLQAINCLQSELKKCEDMVRDEDWEELNKWMKDANRLHDILD